MPIYEYYCRENHTVYQFYAKTLAQGKVVPKCPDNPRFRMEKVLSSFAVTSGRSDSAGEHHAGKSDASSEEQGDQAALAAMEKEFAAFNDDDPKAMGRMMRRMAELAGEKIDGQAEEVVRKLEEGTDPEELEAQLGDEATMPGEDDAEATSGAAKEARHRFKARTAAPRRDPKLYDYE